MRNFKYWLLWVGLILATLELASFLAFRRPFSVSGMVATLIFLSVIYAVFYTHAVNSGKKLTTQIREVLLYLKGILWRDAP